jgi:hypothetical protein
MARKRKGTGKEKYGVIESEHLAPLMKELYPHVGSLTIEYEYEDFDGGQPPAPGARNFPPDSQAFFKIKCPYRECVKGGHDLTKAISNMLRNQKIQAKLSVWVGKTVSA